MVNLIPAINGAYLKGKDKFVLPQRFCVGNIFPEIDEVFLLRLNNASLLGNNGGKFCIDCVKTEKQVGAYRLCVEENKITVQVSERTGYSNALATLFQLLMLGRGSMDCCEIDDKPRFSHRGIMLDPCRHFFSIEEIRKLIEQCSLAKLNVFHLHLSNDQGFRMESETFPALNVISSYRNLSKQDPCVVRGIKKEGERYGGYYTKRELRELVAFAKARGVEIIPEIELPAHASAILAAFPQYTCSGESLKVKSTFGIHDRLFCVGNEDIYPFIERLLDEILEIFPSEYIHLGGDEAPKRVWKKCPKCSKLLDELGGGDALQTYFMNQVCEYIKSKGRTPIVWNDSAASGNLCENAVVQYWAEMGVGKSYMQCELIKGRKIIFSNMNEFYADYSYAEIPLRATLNFEPHVKDFSVDSENVLGVEAPLWTEWLPENADIEKMLYPRLLAVAECGWSNERITNDFLNRAKHYAATSALSVIKPMQWEEATIDGIAALNAIANNMLALSEKYHSMTESDDGETSGTAEAVEAEGAEQVSQTEKTIAYMRDKMKAAYTEEDLKTVLQIMSEKGSRKK